MKHINPTWSQDVKGAKCKIGSISIASARLSTWRRLSWQLAANGANSANSENNGKSADRAKSVNLRVDRDGVTNCKRRKRAVQSDGRELASGERSHAQTCTISMCSRPSNVNKARRKSDYNTHRGRATSFSAQVDITPLYLYIANSCLMLYHRLFVT